MGRRAKAAEHVNHERWLVSYADFITLLFAFFVVMFAVSQVDAKRVGRFQDSFSLAMGLSEGARGYLPSAESARPGLSASMMPLESLTEYVVIEAPVEPRFPEELAEIQRLLEDQKKLESELAGVKIIRRGNDLVLRLAATALFDSGEDRIKSESLDTLLAIAEQMRSRDVQVRVEGHTDDLPIRTTRFRSNWDLSTARATSVVSELVEQGGLAPERVAAVGYAEFRPVAPNTSNEERAKNRRVDFVISVPVTMPVELVAPGTRQEALDSERAIDAGAP